MEEVVYSTGWLRKGNIFAFPHDWQRPAKTEQWAYEKLIQQKNSDIYTQYICFPWATLVDYLNYNPDKAADLLKALDNGPPIYAINVKTFCQHIYALKLIPFFKKMGITAVYWSHKVKGQDEVEGIKFKPYSLYPVMYHKRKQNKKTKPLSERKYLYSFIGSYQPNLYLTEVRKWIFDLPQRNDAVVIERGKWHFEQDVYDRQLQGVAEDKASAEVRKKYEEEYIEVMEESVFCLCPSGSGPNSIRLWEAIEFGCVPILLSDHLDVDCATESQIIRVREEQESVKALPSLLNRCKKRLNKPKNI